MSLAVLLECKSKAVGQEDVQAVFPRLSRRIVLQPSQVRPARHFQLEKGRNSPPGGGHFLRGESEHQTAYMTYYHQTALLILLTTDGFRRPMHLSS